NKCNQLAFMMAAHNFFLGKLDEWASKVAGVVNGYKREREKAEKNLKKGRQVEFGRADVVVGAGEGGYTKAVQLKSTVQDKKAAVNGMLAKAANQLTGETGEQPIPQDRRAIDMEIVGDSNPWPFDQSKRGIATFAEFAKEASNQIASALSNYATG